MRDRELENHAGRLYVTIDTEMDADIHWRKKIPCQFSSVLEGIPMMLRPIWDRYDINPIYFVSPEVIENEECCKVLHDEIEKGAKIGAHLHPEYIEPMKADLSASVEEQFPCFAYSAEVEKEKLYNLMKLINRNLGVKAEWYRAARFGADEDTMKILSELGIKYDSSYTPGINWQKKGGPDHSGVSLERFDISVEGTGSVIKEYPVTIMGKRFGFIGKVLPDHWMCYRWLRPSHMTYLEQKHMIKCLWRKRVQDIVMMFHSMEIMVGKTPYVRNKWMQKYYLWRLERTIEFAKKMQYGGRV